MTNPVLAEIEKIGDSFSEFKKVIDRNVEDTTKETAELKGRIEMLEANGDRPRMSNGKPETQGFKSFPTSNGTVYELAHDVKMADVLPAEKKPPVSLGRWLGATVAGERCQDREALEYVRESKQVTTGTSGVLIPGEYISQWIDLLRANMVLNAAGMRTVTMEAKSQTHSALTSDPASAWHTEAGSISAANPTFAARVLTAQTLVTKCSASVEVTQDSPDFGAQLLNAMARSMAHELDRVGLVGSGSAPEPQGILGTSGVGQITGIGVPTDYSELIQGVG